VRDQERETESFEDTQTLIVYREMRSDWNKDVMRLKGTELGQNGQEEAVLQHEKEKISSFVCRPTKGSRRHEYDETGKVLFMVGYRFESTLNSVTPWQCLID